MDLRSGNTVWLVKDGAPPDYPPLRSDACCEVAILGGGITGAMVALELIRAGRDCLLIDKRPIGLGSTCASTALLGYELDMPMSELSAWIGEKNAAACYSGGLEAIARIEGIARESGDPCEFIRRKSLYLAATHADVEGLKREYAVRRRHGFQVELLQKSEIEEMFSFSRPAALFSDGSAEIDIFRLLSAILKEAVRGGLRAHGTTAMTGYRRDSAGFTLRTGDGFTITARNLVFATGYESQKYLDRKAGTLKSTYAIASRPIQAFPGWHERCLIWDTARPYLYLRTTADGRAVIGGEDIDHQDEVLRDSLLPSKKVNLEHAFHSLFPEIQFDTECAWTGTFGETADSLPYVGETDDLPGAYFAMGYGGNGITFGMICAEIIRDALAGREHRLAPLFSFDRKRKRIG